MSFSRLISFAFAALLAWLPLPARADGLADVLAHKELRHLGIPYANFVTGNGDGLDVEIVQGFARQLGVRYTLVTSDFYSITRDLLGHDVTRIGGKITLTGSYPVRGDIIATGFTVLPWRAQVVLFSQPTFPSQVWLIAPANSPLRPIRESGSLPTDIAQTKAKIGGRSLLVMEKTCLDPANYDLKGKGIDLRAYTRSSNPNEMVPALLNGEADLTLLDVPDALLDLKKWAGRIKVIGPVSDTQELAAAFRPEDSSLRDAFDAYLKRIRADGTYDALVQKYYPDVRSTMPDFFAKYPSGKK